MYRSGIVLTAAALVAIASPALEWNVVSRGGETDVLRGTDTTAGMGTFFFGFVLLVLAAIVLLRGRRTAGRVAAVAAMVVASMIVIVDVYSALAPGRALAWLESEQLAEDYGLSEDRVEDVLRDAFDRGELAATAEPGPWVGAAAGVAA
ncbi:MAG: hypothetical protein M3134_06535, partial [Actinomycetota bacterium]|nr:hypothetical protein [Actinomycetota bacterium]